MRITKISLKDFRAFAQEEPFDLPGGKNLLLYGENGSGKSSLFRALREFLGSHPVTNPPQLLRNIFASGTGGTPTATDGHVTVSLDDGSVHGWEHGQDQARPRVGVVTDARTRSAFLDYRSLLRTSFDLESPDEKLFELAVQVLLANVVPPSTTGAIGGALSIGQLWQSVLSAKPRRVQPGKAAAQRLANALQAFNQGMNAILPSIEQDTALFLSEFIGFNVSLSLPTMPSVYYDTHPRGNRDRKFTNHTDGRGRLVRILRAEVHLNGVRLPAWNEFLNEARLSALALSMYLAGVRQSNSGTPDDPSKLRILVLDDLLIGLDLTNREHVLKILQKHFQHYQIFLLTHDRAWYDLAEVLIEKQHEWAKYELCGSRDVLGDWEVPVVTPVGSDSAGYFISRAKHYHDPAHRDLRTAALYARVAFEVRLKKICEKASVPVAYKIDHHKISAEDLLKAIEAHQKWNNTYKAHRFSIERVKLFRSNVLNPMAHFHPITLAPDEVLAAIHAVEGLKFDEEETNFLLQASALLPVGIAPAANNIINAACYLRTAFEVDLCKLLNRIPTTIKYKEQLKSHPPSLADLWHSGVHAMQARNSAAATTAVGAVTAHQRVFLDPAFDYAHVTTLTEVEVRNALTALRDPATTAPDLKTILATFP